ncbi:hypothetical protein HMI54_008657 [Coelomomyces lativittatus]|nr:hypothetical protein HMI54_008657 [Coelomomyces lativittatus]
MSGSAGLRTTGRRFIKKINSNSDNVMENMDAAPNMESDSFNLSENLNSDLDPETDEDEHTEGLSQSILQKIPSILSLEHDQEHREIKVQQSLEDTQQYNEEIEDPYHRANIPFNSEMMNTSYMTQKNKKEILLGNKNKQASNSFPVHNNDFNIQDYTSRRDPEPSFLPRFNKTLRFEDFFQHWQEELNCFAPIPNRRKLTLLTAALPEPERSALSEMYNGIYGANPNYHDFILFCKKTFDKIIKVKDGEDMLNDLQCKYREGRMTLPIYLAGFLQTFKVYKSEIREKSAIRILVRGLKPKLCDKVLESLVKKNINKVKEVIRIVEKYTTDFEGIQHEDLISKELREAQILWGQDLGTDDFSKPNKNFHFNQEPENSRRESNFKNPRREEFRSQCQNVPNMHQNWNNNYYRDQQHSSINKNNYQNRYTRPQQTYRPQYPLERIVQAQNNFPNETSYTQGQFSNQNITNQQNNKPKPTNVQQQNFTCSFCGQPNHHQQQCNELNNAIKNKIVFQNERNLLASTATSKNCLIKKI